MAFIQGTSGRDDLYSGGNADSLYGYAGDDSLFGNGGKDTLIGGTDDDWLEGGKGADTFVYTIGDGDDTIADYQEIDKIKFTNGTPKFSIKGNDVVITVGTGSNKGTITVADAATSGKANKTITYLDANGDEHIWPLIYDINDARTGVTLRSTYGDDSFDVSSLSDSSDFVTINASAVNHDIEITGNKKNNKIIGGEGNDTIYAGKGNDTLWGGEGDDVYAFTGAAQGKNVIADYEMGDVIKITSGTISSAVISGTNYVFKVKSGSQSTTITVLNAKNKYIQVEDASGNTIWYPENPIPDATYYSGGTLNILKGYKGDAFDATLFGNDFAGKVYTIDASAVTQDIYITGNKYNNTIIGSTNDDTIDGGAGADFISGGKGDDVLIGGNGKDTFSFSSGDGDDIISDYTTQDTILLNGITVSSKKNSNGNTILTLSDRSKVTVVGGAGKTLKIVDDDGADDDVDDVVFNKKGTSATLLSGYDADTFDVVNDTLWSSYSGTLVSVNASAVQHALSITANKKSNYILGTFQNDTISAGAGADTIYGGAGNDVLTGGKGADVFYYNKGDGNDKISDYDEEDTISINGVEVKTVASKNDDVIITLADKKKITVEGGSDKAVTLSINGEETIINPNRPVIYNDDFTAATLKASYSSDSFAPSDYSAYESSLVTIDASRVDHDMTITGNKKANKIIGTGEDDTIYGGAGKDNLQGRNGDDKLYGGSGNDKLYGGNGRDSLWGGTGSDTLYGGDGKDTFIYTLGDGNDTIGDFEAGEKIVVLGAEFRNYRAASGNVTFNFSSGSNNGSILVKDAADKVVTIYDGSNNRICTYDPNE